MDGKPVYLGDGVYAYFDGYHIVIYTHNGIEKTNEIFMDDTVVEALEALIKKLKS
jgi:hypothetical protein